MAGKRKLEIILAGDAKGLSRALGTSQGAASKFESRMGKWGRSLAKIGKAAAIGLGAVGVGVAAGLADALGEAREAAKIQALTDQVIKTTGGAANVTSEQVSGFAESLSQLIGVDDEVIQGAENLILTFTNVRNEAGAGNDIFNQTTVAAMDMATALGVDANGAALQLGKALNDPIKGVTKLTRAGVTFSDEQKEMIKKLQESGDVLGAQKIILAEVGKEFGGAAAAAATPMDRLKVTVGNLKEKIGTALIPIVDKAAVWLSENLPGAIRRSGKFFRDHLKKPLLTVIRVIGDLITDIGEKGLIGVLKDLPGPAKAAAVAIAALGIAIWAALAPVSLIVVGVAAVGAAVYAAQKRFPAFKRSIENTVDYVKEHWPEVEKAIRKVIVAIQGVISAFVAVGTELWATFGDTIVAFARSTWTNIRDYISGVLGVIRGIIKSVTSLIAGDWSGVWAGIKETVLGAWQAINAIVGQAVALTAVILGLAWDTIAGTATAVWDTIKDTVLGAVNTVVDKVNTAITWLSIAWDTVWGGMSSAVLGIWDGITAIVEGGVNAVIGAINAIIRAWNRLSFHTPDISVLGFSAPSFDWESPNIDEIPEVGRGRAGRSRGGGGAAVNAYITINAGLGTDQRELRRTVAKALIEYASANGGIPLKIRSA